MRVINWIAAAAIGIVVTTIVAPIEFVWPTLAIGVGGVLGAGILLVRRTGRKYYAAAGTAYALGLAGVIYATDMLPSVYTKSPYAALLTLGLVSAGIVLLQYVGQRLVKRLFAGRMGEDSATKAFEAVSAIAGLLGMIWTVLTAKEKAARYGGVTIGGTAGFVLNALGVELPIPWFIQNGVDASMVLFVGGLLIGFHTQESMHTTWRATKATAKAGASGAKTAGGKASEMAQSIRGDQSGGE